METLSAPALEINSSPAGAGTQIAPIEPQQISKLALRISLKASTIDGVFAALFSSVTSGVLLTNFLLQLKASPVEIGMLSSIPMLMNFMQPLGAYFAERSTSRHYYCLWIFSPSRLLWLFLALGIGWINWSQTNPHQLVTWTLGIVFVSNILAALGSSCWLSWMAALVPHRLRGRYFGFRNSAASLTTLVSVPLLGFAVSAWPRGTIEGYGVVLLLAIVAGIVSLACQFFMVDENPQQPQHFFPSRTKSSSKSQENNSHQMPLFGFLKDTNFLKFLLYFGLWTFAVNLIVPYYNLYLLNDLGLNLNWVSLYSSIHSAANLVMLVVWGKVADRLGNRPLLLLVGLMVALLPLFWLLAGNNSLSLWLWLPLIHLFKGSLWAAIDLCSSNIQMEVAPEEHPSSYFAIAAAIAGVCGALGTTAGSGLAQLGVVGGLSGVFAISTAVRLVALLPLIFVREPRSQSLMHSLRHLFSSKNKLAIASATSVVADSAQ